MATATIMCPNEYSADIYGLCDKHKGVQLSFERINNQDRFIYKFPLNEII